MLHSFFPFKNKKPLLKNKKRCWQPSYILFLSSSFYTSGISTVLDQSVAEASKGQSLHLSG